MSRRTFIFLCLQVTQRFVAEDLKSWNLMTRSAKCFPKLIPFSRCQKYKGSGTESWCHFLLSKLPCAAQRKFYPFEKMASITSVFLQTMQVCKFIYIFKLTLCAAIWKSMENTLCPLCPVKHHHGMPSVSNYSNSGATPNLSLSTGE